MIKIQKRLANNLVLSLITFTLLIIVLYLMVRIFIFIGADYAWYEKFFGFLLLAALFFVLTHGFGYFLNLFRVINSNEKNDVPRELQSMELNQYPPVAIVVSSFREPIEIVEDTLVSFYNLTYPVKRIYFLDDTRYDTGDWGSEENANLYRQQVDDMCQRINVDLFRRRWRGAKAGMINDFMNFLDGGPPQGFSYQAFTQWENTKSGSEKYIVS
ncbi:MAG: hypothetical protein U9P10_10575 [Thermodesulfobacteriota bacterium]|nr:hypothetical protein [Thermodesulfobacteriota bacterium]